MAGQTIGFIGVGRMGGRMARRLIDAGYPLVVCDASDAAVAPLVEAGARRADTAAAVASEAEIVLASLPTPPVVEAVALGPNGVAEGSASRSSSICPPPVRPMRSASRKGLQPRTSLPWTHP